MTSVDLGHLIIFLELLLSFYIPTLLSWVLVFHCHCPRTRHDIKLFDLYDTILITGADQMWGHRETIETVTASMYCRHPLLLSTYDTYNYNTYIFSNFKTYFSLCPAFILIMNSPRCPRIWRRCRGWGTRGRTRR